MNKAIKNRVNIVERNAKDKFSPNPFLLPNINNKKKTIKMERGERKKSTESKGEQRDLLQKN